VFNLKLQMSRSIAEQRDDMADPKIENNRVVPPELLNGTEQAQTAAQKITDRLCRIQSKLKAIQDQEETLEDFQPHRHLEQAANMLEDLFTQIQQVQATLKGQTS